MNRHLDATELHELETAAADDPRRVHLASCPRCRALVTSFEAFTGPVVAPAGARMPEAEHALAAFLEREIGGEDSAAAAGAARGSDASAVHDTGTSRRASTARGESLFQRLFAPAWRPAWAFAALVVVAGGSWLVSRESGVAKAPEAPIVLRGVPPAPAGGALALEPPSFEGDLVYLSWSAAPEADAYEVRLYSDALVEIGRIAPGPDTFAVLRPSQAAKGTASGATIHWRVVALAQGDEILGSTLGTFTAP